MVLRLGDLAGREDRDLGLIACRRGEALHLIGTGTGDAGDVGHLLVEARAGGDHAPDGDRGGRDRGDLQRHALEVCRCRSGQVACAPGVVAQAVDIAASGLCLAAGLLDLCAQVIELPGSDAHLADHLTVVSL